jgi:hypothetical protein
LLSLSKSIKTLYDLSLETVLELVDAKGVFEFLGDFNITAATFL